MTYRKMIAFGCALVLTLCGMAVANQQGIGWHFDMMRAMAINPELSHWTNNIVGRWTFDASNRPTADAISTNVGVVTAATWVENDGYRASPCYYFNGTNSKIIFAAANTSILTPGTTSLTMSAWVRFSGTNSISTQGRIFGRTANDATSSRFALYSLYNIDTPFRTLIQAGGGTSTVGFPPIGWGDIVTTNWYHFCTVWSRGANALNGATNAYIYINGVLRGTTNITASAGNISTSAQDFGCGLARTSDFAFMGYIDDPIIWMRPLSSQEVYQAYIDTKL